MSKLNGLYLFYYSEGQLKGKKKFTKEENLPFKKTYVLLKSKDDIQEEEYTECVHKAYRQASNYEPHEKRFEDSVYIAAVENPEIREERVKDD